MTRDNNNTNWLPWTKLLVGTFVGLLAAGGGVSAWLGVFTDRPASNAALAVDLVMEASAAPTENTTKPGLQKLSTLCRFNSGPRAGETQDYAPMDPLPVGSRCQDGRGSTGSVVAGPY